MPKSAIEPCIPSRGKVPDRPEWIPEIKHDGYRLIVQRDGKRVRLFTKNGHDCTDRCPFIVEAASRMQIPDLLCWMAKPYFLARPEYPTSTACFPPARRRGAALRFRRARA